MILLDRNLLYYLKVNEYHQEIVQTMNIHRNEFFVEFVLNLLEFLLNYNNLDLI